MATIHDTIDAQRLGFILFETVKYDQAVLYPSQNNNKPKDTSRVSSHFIHMWCTKSWWSVHFLEDSYRIFMRPLYILTHKQNVQFWQIISQRWQVIYQNQKDANSCQLQLENFLYNVLPVFPQHQTVQLLANFSYGPTMGIWHLICRFKVLFKKKIHALISRFREN